jgi:hypothetical protein
MLPIPHPLKMRAPRDSSPISWLRQVASIVAEALIRLADKYFRDQDANIVEVLAVEGHPY